MGNAEDIKELIRLLWGLSPGELEHVLGAGAGYSTALRDMAIASEALQKHVTNERICEVVRQPAALLRWRSLLEMAMAGGHAEVRVAVTAMFDVRRVQP